MFSKENALEEMKLEMNAAIISRVYDCFPLFLVFRRRAKFCMLCVSRFHLTGGLKLMDSMTVESG